MPTYTYFCKKCNKEFDEMHSITTKLEKCTTCDSEEITRLISKGSTFQLQGDGWAKDNYSKK